MSLALLLGTELSVDVEASHEVFGINAPGPYVERVAALGITHVPVRSLTRSWAPASALEQELASLTAAGVDSEATLDVLLDRLGDPHALYHDLQDADRRRYNQAWFEKIFIDTVDPDVTTPLNGEAVRTPIARALNDCRDLVDTEGPKNAETDPGVRFGSASQPFSRSGFY